jgi:hypothetical protein
MKLSFAKTPWGSIPLCSPWYKLALPLMFEFLLVTGDEEARCEKIPRGRLIY